MKSLVNSVVVYISKRNFEIVTRLFSILINNKRNLFYNYALYGYYRIDLFFAFSKNGRKRNNKRK